MTVVQRVDKSDTEDIEHRFATIVPRIQRFSAENGPIFVEFLGSAGAGKSTMLQRVCAALRHIGYRVEIPRESYLRVPTRTQGVFAPRLSPLDPEMNVLTMLDTEARLMAMIPRQDLDLVLAERGPLDAEVFAEFHARRRKLQPASHQAIVRFQQRPEMTTRFLVAIALCVPPEVTVQRTPERSVKKQSFRNQPDNLRDYQRALDAVTADNSEWHLARIDATRPQEAVFRDILKAIIERLEYLFMDDVLVIPRGVLLNFLPDVPRCQAMHAPMTQKFMSVLGRSALSMPRSSAEKDSAVVQVVAAIVSRVVVGGESRIVLRNRTSPARIQGLVAWKARHVAHKRTVKISLARTLDVLATETGVEHSWITPNPYCAIWGGVGLTSRHLGLFWEGQVAWQQDNLLTLPVLTAMATLKEAWSRLALANLPEEP